MPIRIEVKKPEWLRHKSPEEIEKEKKQKQMVKKTKEQQRIQQKKQSSPSHESAEDIEQDAIIPQAKSEPIAPTNNGQKPASKLIQKQIRVKGKLVDGSEVAVTCDAIIDGEDIYVKNEGCTTEITPPPASQSPASSPAKTESNKVATSK
jgi:hypothetical protein